MNNQTDQIEGFFEAGKLDKAIQFIEKGLAVDSENEALYFWLGKVHFKKQEWGKAINAFSKVLELNPENKDAQSHIDMANNILGYFTPDMFNP